MCAVIYNSLGVQWKYQDKPGKYVELDVMRKPSIYWNVTEHEHKQVYII